MAQIISVNPFNVDYGEFTTNGFIWMASDLMKLRLDLANYYFSLNCMNYLHYLSSQLMIKVIVIITEYFNLFFLLMINRCLFHSIVLMRYQ